MLKTIYKLLVYIMANYIGITLPVWLLVGNIYNHVFQDYIKASLDNLYQQVATVEYLSKYPHTDYEISRSRALISKKIFVSYDIDKTFSMEELELYLKKRGYTVEKKRLYTELKPKRIDNYSTNPENVVKVNTLNVEMRNEDYIISMELTTGNNNDSMLIMISYNDFLSKQND